MKQMRWFCVVMAMLCLMVMVPDNAFAYEDATNRITIYSQFGLKNGKTNNGSASSYLYTEDPYLLHGGNRICESDSWVAGKSWNGKKDCLAQGGCNLFAYAHAIQWVLGRQMGNDLILDLLDICCGPSNNWGHKYCHHKGDSFDAYNSFAQSKGIAVTIYKKDHGDSKDVAWLREHFNNGECFTIWKNGHYLCAVDYVVCDTNGNILDDRSSGDIYIQIIDSAPTSGSKTSRFGNCLYELSSDGSRLVKKTPSVYKKSPRCYGFTENGRSYFVKVSSLNVNVGFAYLPGTEQIGEFDLVAEIEAVVTTRSDKGITEYKLQDEPYAAATTNKKVAPGTDLTTTGVYKNKHGNYWLKFTDGTYLCANDVKLKTPVTAPETSGLVYPKGNLTFGKSFDLKGTIKSKSTMSEVWAAVYKPDGGKIDDTSYAVTAKLENVKSVDIYTSALNKSSLGGISFSKLAKGDYYFTLWAYYYTYQDVEKTSENPLRRTQAVFLVDEPFTVGSSSSSSEEDNDAVDLCTLNAKFTYNKDANTHKLPYAASTKMGSVKAGQTVTVTKLVQNRYNNIWAQLSDGSYMCFYDQSKDERYMTFISTNALEVSDDAKMPTGDIPLATSFGLRGTITSDTPMLMVTAQVTDLATGKVAVGPAIASTVTGGILKSVTLNEAVNGTNINDIMSFKKLTTAGYYRYEVLVQLGFVYAYDGEVFRFGTEQVVISSDFTAGSPDEEITLPDVPDDPIPEPILVERIDVTMDGTYGFYGDPCEFSWEVYPNDATDKSVTWTSSNEDVIKLQMTEQGTMKLCYVNCGMTAITVKANDGSGISKSYQVTVVPKLHYSWNLRNDVVVGKTISGYLELSVEPSTANINIVSQDKNIFDVKFQETSPGEYDVEVFGINPGHTYVLAQASSNGYLNSCWTDITVRQPVYVESIDIYGLPSEMKVGETADLYYVFNPENNDCTSWGVFSSDPSIVEVQHEEAYWDEYGNYVTPVIARAPGTATITVEADDGSEVVATHTITIKGSVLSGDANEDGVVNAYDALIVLQYSAGWDVILNADNADVDKDCMIGLSDAVQILRYCAGGDLVSALRALKDLLGDIDINMLEIVKQPVDQHVSIDQTAQFAVTVTGESVTYQWYINRNDGKDWCKLNGASGSAYVTSAVEADNDGFQYRCVITDVYGNELTSDIAVLHVVLELPVTGDASTPVLWLVLCVLSALGILFMSRRRVFR